MRAKPFAFAVALVATAAIVATISGSASATAPTCASSGVTVTSMHSPDGTLHPFYADFGHASTNHSGYVGYELSGGSLSSDLWIKLSGFPGSIGLASHQSASIPARATSQGGNRLIYAYLTATAAVATAQSFTVEVWSGKPNQAGSSELCDKTDGFSSIEDVISANSNKITSISVSNSSPAIGGSFDVTAVGDTGTIGAGPANDQSAGNGPFSLAPAMDDSWPADAFSLAGVRVALGGTTTYDRLRLYPAAASGGAYTATYTFTVRGSTSTPTSVLPVQNIASGTQVKYTGSYPGTATLIPVPTISASLTKTAISVTGPPYHVGYQVVVSNTATSPVVLDYMRDTPTPSGVWAFITGSAKRDGVTIADPSLDSSAGTLLFSGPFTVPAKSGAVNGTTTFTYSLSMTATVTNSVVGTVGGTDLGGSSPSDNQIAVDPTTPIVSTTSLANATAGSSYSQTLAATGGTGTYTWSVTTGSLPSGLSLAASTGVISGTPTAAGAATFTVTATDATPRSGNKSLTLTIDGAAGGGGGGADTSAPTGSVSIDGGATTTASTTATLTLGASDDTGVAAYRVAAGSDCSSATWVAVTSATTFSGTSSVTLPAGDGTKTVCAAYKDAAGNISTTATATIVLDTTAPTVTLGTTTPNPTNGAFVVTATFAEAVSGFAAGDVTVANGTVSGFAGSGTAYTFTVTPSGSSTVTVDVAANAASDAAGNGNTAAAQLSRSVDLTAPTVVLSAPSGTLIGATTVTATFSESVTGFTSSDLTVTNGTISAFAGSGTTYTFTVTPIADGTVTVDVAANTASDTAGNGNTVATQLSRVADITRPSIALSTPAGPWNGATTITATFSESVTGFTSSDLSVTNGTVSAFTGSGTTYTFTLTPVADGTVTVDVAANSASDIAGNGNTAATQLSRTVDTTPPSVALVLHPPLQSTDDSPQFTFTADPGTTTTCSTDGGPFVPCAGSVTLSGLSVGSHTLTVRATDAAANTAEQTFTWTLEPLTVTFTAQPDANADDSATFSWKTNSANATFTCTLDGAAAACASPYTVANLSDGAHTFTVSAAGLGTQTASATVSWRSTKRIPIPSIVIIPKITATDLLGRPSFFKQSADAPHSNGPFTRKLDVRLQVPTPDDVTRVIISNYPDFTGSKEFAPAADGEYDWQLLAGPSGDRPVYIRYDDAPGSPVGEATIVLDQELPALKPVPRKSTPADAGRVVQAGDTAYCGKAARRWLQLPGADGFSGLNALQIASDPQHPCEWRSYLPTVSYRLPGRTVYLRIEDRVGNISPWYRIRVGAAPPARRR